MLVHFFPNCLSGKKSHPSSVVLKLGFTGPYGVWKSLPRRPHQVVLWESVPRASVAKSDQQERRCLGARSRLLLPLLLLTLQKKSVPHTHLDGETETPSLGTLLQSLKSLQGAQKRDLWNCWFSHKENKDKNTLNRTYLVVWWLRICLLMPWTWVQSWVRELTSHMLWGN